MNPLQSLSSYEQYVYTLPQQTEAILRSTLVVARRGATIAVLNGQLVFINGLRLVVREKLSFAPDPGQIKGYGYEVWRGNELLYWYDSQPHPDEPTLASTDPHHKHVPPDIKHNRVPAPGLVFDAPNLPFLIAEIESLFVSD